MAIQFPSDEELRKRFWELRAQETKIRAESAPYRQEYDKLNQQIEALLAQQRDYSDTFKKIEAPLFDGAMEMSKIVALLKGKTGEAPE